MKDPTSTPWRFFHQSVITRLKELHEEGYKICIFSNVHDPKNCRGDDEIPRFKSVLNALGIPVEAFIATARDKVSYLPIISILTNPLGYG
jgi:hypothetical protein